MRHVKHDDIRSAVLDERLQLVLEVPSLLSCKPWYGIISMKTSPRHTVAGLTIVDLGLTVVLRNSRRRCVFCETCGGKNNGEDGCLQRPLPDDVCGPSPTPFVPR